MSDPMGPARAPAPGIDRPPLLRQLDVVDGHGEGVTGLGALDVDRSRDGVDRGRDLDRVPKLFHLGVGQVVGLQRDAIASPGPDGKDQRVGGGEGACATSLVSAVCPRYSWRSGPAVNGSAPAVSTARCSAPMPVPRRW